VRNERKRKMKNINVKELLEAMDELEKEKGIKSDYLIEALENALVTAYKKNFESAENVKVVINKELGQVHVYSVKKVVRKVENPLSEITQAMAKRINKEAKTGDEVDVEINPKDFGRIAAQTAKQVVVQKIREAERDIVYNEYSNKRGEIVVGIVKKIENGTVILDLGKLEGIMTERDQIPTEKYELNQKIRGYVADVRRDTRGKKENMQVSVSRTNPDFVRKLFEFEIPEIYEGLIEIKSIYRDPGSRSKIAVYSKNPDIDPVGSCVGKKGIRIQNIINELNGEKIDVIEWNEEPSIYIASSLLPATVMAVDINDEEKFARVIVPDDQLSLAIGKSGQNARLAAGLTGTGWKIDIKSESEIRKLILEAQGENEEDADEESDEGYEIIYGI
jgi:N utilization substance protein A